MEKIGIFLAAPIHLSSIHVHIVKLIKPSYCPCFQAHREVFEYLIEDFKTYKPLLSAIKNEYEMMFAFQRQQIRELEPLKVSKISIFPFSWHSLDTRYIKNGIKNFQNYWLQCVYWFIVVLFLLPSHFLVTTLSLFFRSSVCIDSSG